MEKKSDRLLIIFYKNPVKGTVKTRIAAAVGEKKALFIYQLLSTHTRDITVGLPIDKVVYYSTTIDNTDLWSKGYHKVVQEGKDLGERMSNAFKRSFESGYTSVCIIGTDCLEISGETVMKAFQELTTHDAVIGPARDGGYYLLGMNAYHSSLFTDKQWSTNSVASDTMNDLMTLQLTYHILPLLSDVDKIEDLPEVVQRELL